MPQGRGAASWAEAGDYRHFYPAPYPPSCLLRTRLFVRRVGNKVLKGDESDGGPNAGGSRLKNGKNAVLSSHAGG
jgi:hypothetical protein